MNTIRSCRYLWSQASRNINLKIDRNARFFSANITVDIDSKTGISTVTFNRRPVNSLTLELVNEFVTVMMQVEKEKARGMILTSSIPRIFCAGLDLKELYKPNVDRMRNYWTAVQDMWLHLYSYSYPTAVAIPGHSPGAGCLIAISCDYRIMVKGDFGIGMHETRLGLAVPTWFVDTIRNVIPKRESEQALITGKLFKVDEALKIGLIDDVAENKEEAVQKAEKYILDLSENSMVAMAQTKLTIRYGAIRRLQDNRDQDLRVFMKFVTAPENQKAIEDYLEKMKKRKK